MKVELRDYQTESVAALNSALDEGHHPLCVLPTGAGKSLVLAALVAQREQRALVLSHVAELLEQDSKALRRVAPQVRQSFFVAGLGEKDPTATVVFGSVQSVVRSLRLFRVSRPLVFVDEAHLCPRKADAMYSQVFAHFMGAQRIGLTATPKRLDSGSLIEGDSAWFDCIGHEVGVKELIEKKWLLPLSGVISELQADLAGVASRGGDFVQEQAAAAVQRTLSIAQAVSQAASLAKRRKSWLVFAASIAHANEVHQELQRQGIRSALVTSETSSQDRAAALEMFRAGEVQALTNVGVLTTGFDAPCTDCIVSMRPTKSDVLWQQMLGRGMRLAQGKVNCLLLDFVGNLERLGGVGCISETVDRRGTIKNAKDFLEDQVKQKQLRKQAAPDLFDASSRDPMVNGETFDAMVQRIRYTVVPSRRFPGKAMVMALYDLEDQFGRALRAREFLCVEYPGGARHRAEVWFAKRGVLKSQVPANAEVARTIAYALEAPTEVTTRFDRKLQAYVIEEERFALAA